MSGALQLSSAAVTDTPRTAGDKQFGIFSSTVLFQKNNFKNKGIHLCITCITFFQKQSVLYNVLPFMTIQKHITDLSVDSIKRLQEIVFS